MTVLICPGIHDPQLTQQFVQSFCSLGTQRWLIFPAQKYPAYSSVDILDFLQKHLGDPAQASPLLFISFSAGVVGAMGAATMWQMQSGRVKGLIALDGWGVPLFGSFPMHRISHDAFTHWSSALLGRPDSFYAEPAVEHLELWRSPNTALGCWVKAPGCQVRCSAAEFLTALLQKYREQ